jgi:hypothetical protein
MQNGTFLLALWALTAFTGNHTQIKTTEPGGVYASYTDFTTGKLTWEKHVEKSRSYGYRDSKNRDYRFYNNSAYRVLDTVGFFLYYTYRLEHPAGGKGMLKTDHYYFSVTGTDALQPLTVENLKKAFPGNHAFHYRLDAGCKSDNDLTAYDNYLKTYRIKYLFNPSSK